MDIPEDVIIEIIGHLLPSYSSDLHSLKSRDPNNPKALPQCHQAKAVIGSLRLASRKMNVIASRFFYEEVVISLTKPPNIEKLDFMFSSGSRFLRILIIDGRAYRFFTYRNHEIASKETLTHHEDFLKAIEEGLGKCTQLRRLEALGDHRMFKSRSWVKTLSAKTPNLVSLVYHSGKDISLDHVLVAFGPRLETLTIVSNHGPLSSPPLYPLHLPAAFPNLRKLVLDGWFYRDQLIKLFSRICPKPEKRPSASTRASPSPLRELVIMGDIGRGTQSSNNPITFIQALPRNIGLHLTVLHFLPTNLLMNVVIHAVVRGISLPFHQIAQIISKACPNLVQLSLPCTEFCSELNCIPNKVKHLSVVITASQPGNSVTIDPNARARSLKTLGIFLSGRMTSRLRLIIKKNSRNAFPTRKVAHPYLNNGLDGIEVLFGNQEEIYVGTAKCGSATENE